MPTLTAPQMYFLEMQSEKTFGKYDKLRRQVVVLSPADAVAALIDGTGQVTAAFASPPYTQIALKDEAIHPILRSEDVIGGKASFLLMGATPAYMTRIRKSRRSSTRRWMRRRALSATIRAARHKSI